MAEFGIQATQLSASQGQGASVISPVEQAPTVSKTLDNGISPLVSSIVDVFAKGLTETRKADAEKLKNTIVQGYINGEVAINDAVASGQMTPQEASARSRANFNRNAAGYGQYIEDFQKAGAALKGYTEKGEVEKQLETDAKRLDNDVKQAQERGFQFLPGMTGFQIDAQIKAAKAGVRADNAMKDFYQAQGEKRAQGTYDAGVAAREQKDLSFTLVNDVASTNLAAFGDFGAHLSDQVKSGKMAPEMAQATLANRFASISGSMQAAARVNPELAAPYRSLFEDLNKVNQKLIDPKNAEQDLQSQLSIIQTRMKLVAMNDPKIAAAVVANQLLPNNASLALSSAPEGVKAIAILSSIKPGDNTYRPTVIGNPDAEESTLRLLKDGLGSLNAGKTKDPAVAKVQASNSVNAILKETGAQIDKGATPQQLKGVASFFASPEYAKFVTSGAIDPEAAGAAKKTFQIIYEPAIINGVQQRLDGTLDREPVTRGSQSKTGVTEKVKIADAVDVKFTGSGVNFVMKETGTLSPAERVSQQSVLNELKTAQQGLNQLIHIGAHMEGTTDYAKYWEDNKHVYLPNIYPDPVRLKPGKVIDGYQYIGGNYRDRANWKPAN